MTETTTIFRALSDPNRRAIFERLTAGELGVKELTAALDISQPAVSQHLAILDDAGLVIKRRQGRRTFYHVPAGALRPLHDWLEQYRAFWTERLDALHTLLDEMDDHDDDP